MRDLKIETLVSVALDAGKVLIDYFRRRKLSHEEKTGRSDLVTEADLASQKTIVERLSRVHPDVPVVGEEGAHERQKGAYFLVDPLDGTLNFFHGLPYFSISIALVEGDEPIAGVIHAPALSETFYAVKGEGAYLDGERLTLNSDVDLSNAIAATGWPYDGRLVPWTEKAISLVQREVQEVRIMGSAALEMCYIAAGFLDLYWEVGLAPWDLAAGYVIAKEAGSVVSDVNGEEFRFTSGRVLACGNEKLHKAALKIIGSGGSV